MTTWKYRYFIESIDLPVASSKRGPVLLAQRARRRSR